MPSKSWSRRVCGTLSTRKMNRNYIPKSKYRRTMKEDLNFVSLAMEMERIESEWVSVKPVEELREIKFYDDTGSSITTFITTNQPAYIRKVDYKPKTKIVLTESLQIREKGYYKFVDLTMQIEPSDEDCISITTTDENINKLRSLNEEFVLNQKLEFDMANLQTEEIVINVCHDIAKELEIEPCNISIQKILSHFIDSKPIHIYNSVIKLFAQVLNLPDEKIKSKVESKLKSYDFLYSEMNAKSIEFLQSNNTQNHDGLRMIWYNKEINPIAKSIRKINSDSKIANELKEIFRKSKESNVVSMCSPIYRDAIAFRNLNNEMVGFFNICFECNKIESHNRTEMPVSKELIDKLREIMNPVDNGY